MRGLQLIEKKTSVLHKSIGAEQLRAIFLMVCAGVVAGALASSVRLHLSLPGHKALFWLTPLVMARLLTRSPIGGTVGSVTAAFTAIGMGGHLGGGIAYLPVIGLAGIALDFAAGVAEKGKHQLVVVVPLMVVGGMIANLFCMTKRVLGPVPPRPHVILGMSGMWVGIGSYIFFGLTAGLVGALGACAIIWFRRGKQS